MDLNILNLPKSNVLVFHQCDSEESFLFSLKALAAKLNITPAALDEKVEESTSFNTSSFVIQCNVLFECIQEELKKHPGWIMVFDNIQSTSPLSVIGIIKQWFMDDGDSWSKGTAVLVYDGCVDHIFGVKEDYKYLLRNGYVFMLFTMFNCLFQIYIIFVHFQKWEGGL